MNNKGYIILLVVIAAVIVGYLYFNTPVSAPAPQTAAPLTSAGAGNKAPAPSASASAVKTSAPRATTPPPAASTRTTQSTPVQPGSAYNPLVQVSYLDSGFSPARLVVHLGQTVQFLNLSGTPLWVASDPEPTHDGYPGFDENGVSQVGESYQFTFNKLGTFGYDNHVDQAMHGVIIVEQ